MHAQEVVDTMERRSKEDTAHILSVVLVAFGISLFALGLWRPFPLEGWHPLVGIVLPLLCVAVGLCCRPRRKRV